jgi:uncharacterized phosphosugar-binding protein
MKTKDFSRYSKVAVFEIQKALESNQAVFEKLHERLVEQVQKGGRLLIFGSGHSSVMAFEAYHRAGGPSFVFPLVADYLLPTAGPPIVRRLERTPGIVEPILARAQPTAIDTVFIFSQSGMNPSTIDLALAAKKASATTVAWSSLKHSASVKSRHPSGKKLYEVCDHAVDLGGVMGDAAVEVSPRVMAGPISTLSGVFLLHSLLVEVSADLELAGKRVVYTSVNTPGGEERNRAMEAEAAKKDWLMRDFY